MASLTKAGRAKKAPLSETAEAPWVNVYANTNFISGSLLPLSFRLVYVTWRSTKGKEQQEAWLTLLPIFQLPRHEQVRNKHSIPWVTGVSQF